MLLENVISWSQVKVALQSKLDMVKEKCTETLAKVNKVN